MSDRSAALPPAAVDIGEYRATAERAVAGERMPRVVVLGIAVAAAVIVVTAVGAILADRDAVRVVVAAGVIVILLAGTGLVMVPLRIAAQRQRARVDAAASALDRTAAAFVAHLASIGYNVPLGVAADWLRSPQPTATVPLVHDSVIAARWWRPAEGDDRVFLEPFLRQDGADSTLPVLPALQGG